MIYLVFNVLCKNNMKDINVFNTEGFYFVDYIFISTGTSLKHISSSAFKLSKYLKEYYDRPCYVSGLHTDWIVMDFNAFVIHLMLNTSRNYYDLDSFYVKQFNKLSIF